MHLASMDRSLEELGMEDKPKFKVINTPEEPREIRNFWKCCPLTKEYMPETACPEGKPNINPQNGKIQNEPRCSWWINDKNSNYCFWRYLKDKSDPDGVMKELVQSELAQLFGWSNTKTHFMLKQAIEELTEAFKIYGAIELLRDMDAQEFEEVLTQEFDYDD